MSSGFQSKDWKKQGGQYKNDFKKPEASLKNDLPEYYEVKYTDQKKRLDFIVVYPPKIAEMLSNRNKYNIKDTENNSTQIRKYFELVRNLETLIKLDKISIEEALVELNRLRALAEYARNGGKVTGCFVEFINVNLDKIENKEDLVFFAKHFEAVIGYLKKDSKGGNRK